MQTAEGKWPQKTTSAECAALFDLVILPTLRSFYLQTKEDGSTDYAAYADLCRKFASEELKLPEHLWSMVHLPAYISWDNASIHHWWHRLCFKPRQPEEKLRAALAQRFEEQFGLPAYMANAFRVFTSAHEAPQRRRDDAVQGVRDFLRAPAPQTPEQRDAVNAGIMFNTIDEYNRAHNCRWVQDQLHELSLKLPGMMCLVPQQIMPLAPVTPDIHCPIEHLVGTIKMCVRDRLLQFDVPDADLQLGKTYEGWLREAVMERGNGERGKHHVERSVKKQKCICEILRTPAGQQVTVEFEFGSTRQDAGRKKTHVANGTDGAWIRDSKWT